MSDKYVIEFGDEEFLMGEHSYRRIMGTNTLMCEDEVKLLSKAPYYEPVEENKKTIWDLEDGDSYFFVTDEGDVNEEEWSHISAIDHYRRQIGNAFLTEEEADFYERRQEVIGLLRQYAEPLDTPWDGIRHHFYLVATLSNKEVSVAFDFSFKTQSLYFATEEDAREGIAIVGEADLLKYYFMVKEEQE